MLLLVQPKEKLFISRGGLCRSLEALNGSVAVLDVPLLRDQTRNTDFSLRIGMAVSDDFGHLTYQRLLKCIV